MKFLENCMLFKNIPAHKIEETFALLQYTTQKYNKNQFVLHSGDKIISVGIVVKGAVHIIKEDIWGNRSILSEIAQGEIFGEAYACVNDKPLEISVIAAEPSTVIFINVKNLLLSSHSNKYYNIIINNLLGILAYRNIMLTEKIEHISKRTTKEKLMSYLCSQAEQQKSQKITIPFNRQQLADYLSVDRSALSAEMSKLKAMDIIDYNKNYFELKKPIIP